MAATCTESGVYTYVCECGDSYTEEISANGHDFIDGFCVDCGVEDPDYESPDDGNKPGGDEIPDDNQPGDDENTENDGNNGDDTDNGETPEGGEGTGSDAFEKEEPEKLNFFRKIWRAIVDFFARLFGKKS